MGRNTTGAMAMFAILSGALVLASCSNEHTFELTLRNREIVGAGDAAHCRDATVVPGTTWTRCDYDVGQLVWTDGGGRSAVMPAHIFSFTVAHQDFGKFDCGGHTVSGVNKGQLVPNGFADTPPFQLNVDDGSVITLVPEDLHYAVGLTNTCTDESGSWRGIAGEVNHRSGTYTIVNNSLQSVLHLTED